MPSDNRQSSRDIWAARYRSRMYRYPCLFPWAGLEGAPPIADMILRPGWQWWGRFVQGDGGLTQTIGVLALIGL